MTKTLDFAYETTHEIKVGDDETTFTLVCKNEDLPVDLTAAKSITAKIGSRSGYLREQPISIDNLAKLPTGQFKFNFDKDTLDNFPTGSYFLEVWVTDDQGTSIYPSGNPLNFIVTANIENSSGANITTVAYDDFVEAMNKAASTIAKGDKGDDGLSAYQIAVINGYHGSQTDWLASLKGDTGTVDNAGLISAPAFQSLQTQVDNSAVGTNLLKNTRNLSSTSTTTSWGILFDSSQIYDSGIMSLSGVSAMTFSFDVYVPLNSNVGSPISVQLKGQNSQATNVGTDDYNTLIGSASYVIKQNDLGKTIRASFSIQSDHKYKSFDAALADTASITIRQGTDVSGFVYSKIKLEKGSVATDWCLNPSEILTQSDYAKIKAAIVALGGALS